MSQLTALPKVQKRHILAQEPYSVEYLTEHLFCNNCSSEDFPLNAPKFTFTTPNSVVTFNFLPMSGYELAALAIFFKTAGTNTRTVHFDQVPGFRITSRVVNSDRLELLFHADSDMHKFMGYLGSANLVSVQLTYTQLDYLADQILDSAATCR